MADLIERQAAIDAHCELCVDRDTCNCDICPDVEVFQLLPSAQPEPQWIPCSERIPGEKRETYWVCTDAESQHECRWTNNVFGIGESDTWGWSIFDIPQYTKVLAWMPLPEPYKEGKS